MRVGVVDIGTNSTRLLIADVTEGRIRELERRTEITRLGQGVDATGALADEAQERVFAVLAQYREAINRHGVQLTTAVLTSAVRDATNGAEFTDAVRTRYGLDARTIAGDTEAQLTFLGATAERAAAADGGAAAMVVIDIGGGSTEYVVGEGGAMSFHVSTQAGVVRQTERHLHTDPPRSSELQELAQEVRSIVAESVPADVRDRVEHAVAVAGTATSCAAIDLELEPYDPDRVQGHLVSDGTLEEMLARLAEMTVEQRRALPGLHPDRAPTIVAGVVILLEALRAFGLHEFEASEHDLLWGAALTTAADAAAERA